MGNENISDSFQGMQLIFHPITGILSDKKDQKKASREHNCLGIVVMVSVYTSLDNGRYLPRTGRDEGTGRTHGQTDRLAQLTVAIVTGSSYIYSEVQGATLIASQTLVVERRTFTSDDKLPCGR